MTTRDVQSFILNEFYRLQELTCVKKTASHNLTTLCLKLFKKILKESIKLQLFFWLLYLDIWKYIFACLFSVFNTISLSRHEQLI